MIVLVRVLVNVWSIVLVVVMLIVVVVPVVMMIVRPGDARAQCHQRTESKRRGRGCFE
jgi:hypothetical protein